MHNSMRRALALGALLVGLPMASCTDPAVSPSSTSTEDIVFKDLGAYRSFLAKIYAGLAVSGQQGPAGKPDIEGIDEGFSQYLRLYWEAQELPTDEAIIAWGDPGLPEMNTQIWSDQNPFLKAMYYRVFFQVSTANEFLRQTTDSKLAERKVPSPMRAQIQTFRAEARFLRALSYWHGLDLFANIPLVTEADAVGSPPPAQHTRQEIYDYVISELNEIKPQLPIAAGHSTYGRATDAAANMLLAHVYLNAEVYTGTPHYAEARAAAEAAIAGGFTLDPSYRHLFLADNNTSPEIIFPIEQDGIHTQTFGGVTFLSHAGCGGSMDPATYGLNGCWYGLRLKPEAFNRYATNDPRRGYFYENGQTVNITAIDQFGQGIAAPKYSNVTSAGVPGSNGTHVDIDFPMFRLADAYLIYAEAVVRGAGGDRVTALGYINAIRERAYGNASADITDPEMTLDFLLDERSRELLWEAHRRPDLIRFGKFTGASYIWTFKGGVAAGQATESFRDLYPLPAPELVANPNLHQNPNY